MKKVLFGTRKRRLVVLIAAVLVTAGSAYAAWSLTSNGSAKGKLGMLQALTIVDATTAPSGQAIPGGNGDLAIKVTNPNSGVLTLTGVSANGTPTNPSGTPGCASASQAGITMNTLSGLTISIPAGTTDNIVIPNVYALAANSPSSCQGTTWSFPITVTASAGT